MKPTILILLSIIILCGCQKAPNQIFLNVKALNYSGEYAFFIYDTVGYNLSSVVDSIKIDRDGTFNVDKEKICSDALLVLIGKEKIKLTIPVILNKPLEIVVDCNKPDSITAFGEQAPFLSYKLDQLEYWRAVFNEVSGKHEELANGDNQNSNYHLIQDSITELRLQYLSEYFKDLEIPGRDDFLENERNSLLFSSLYYRMSGQKPDIVERLAFYNKTNKSNATYLSYSKSVSFSNEKLFELSYYREFMNDFIMNAVRNENPNGDLSNYEFYLNNGLTTIDKWFTQSQTNTLQKVNFINHLVETAKVFKEPIKVHEFQKVVNQLGKNQYEDKYFDVIDHKLQELNHSLMKFSPGSAAPFFKLNNPFGKEFRSSDFSGKTLFIDVWASWCKPCVSSFPKWNNLVQDSKENKNLQFISISVDQDTAKWMNAIRKYQLQGLKLHAGPDGFKSSFAKDFEITGVPAYLAIDRHGKILSISSTLSDLKKIAGNLSSKAE